MSHFVWEDVSDLSGAEKAIKGGFWAAVFVATVTTVVVAVSFSGVKLFGIGPSALIDAAIFAAIAVGIKRRSRFAAVAGLILYVIERIYMIQQVQMHQGSRPTSGIVMGLLFTLLFVNAVRGAYAYHRLTQARPLTPMPGQAQAR